METEKKSQIALYSAEVNKEVADPKVMEALIATTFKKMQPVQVRQAMLEGRIRGFTIKDFFVKNVYAIAYGNTYSLVTSIDLARKRGARGGVIGTSKPVYTYTEENGKKKIESCERTVYTKGGHPDGFTATVYFSEFYKEGKTWDGKYTPSMWDQKPHMMIGKVAEMHALRMACPEELGQIYVEEEFDRAPETVSYVDVDELKKDAPTTGKLNKANHEKGKKTDVESAGALFDVADNHAGE